MMPARRSSTYPRQLDSAHAVVILPASAMLMAVNVNRGAKPAQLRIQDRGPGHARKIEIGRFRSGLTGSSAPRTAAPLGRKWLNEIRSPA